jgi:hypothetical protein
MDGRQRHTEDEERSHQRNPSNQDPVIVTGTGSTAAELPPGFLPPGLPPIVPETSNEIVGHNLFNLLGMSSSQPFSSGMVPSTNASGRLWPIYEPPPPYDAGQLHMPRAQPILPSAVAVSSQQSSHTQAAIDQTMKYSIVISASSVSASESYVHVADAAVADAAVEQAEGHPRMKLNERYQQKYQLSLLNTNFISWADTSNGDHAPYWTSVFVCPKTGEAFRSGELVNPTHKGGRHLISGSPSDAINWYGGKKNAEAAAAGRAEDCFRFRAMGAIPFPSLTHRFCKEVPYVETGGKSITLPARMPSECKQRVIDFQNQASQKR